MKLYCIEEHPELRVEGVDFRFKILKRFKSPFQRQIAEAIIIGVRTRKGEETLLNSKQEFSMCVLPELEVMMQDKIIFRDITE